MKAEFFKYQGTGNDFVIFNNMNGQIPALTVKQVNRLCDRKFGIGADGLMLLSKKEGYDFEMIYYNADGNESSMCGNGGRCLVKFAYHQGIHREEYKFIAIDGEHDAEIDTNGIVSLKMKDVDHVEQGADHAVLNTGSPHYIKFSSNVKDTDVVGIGRAIRYSNTYGAEGINVNFVETIDNDTIYVRTYERGVEDETLSCGTGVTAAALVSAHNDNGFNQVEVETPGGHLSVEFDKLDDNHFENIWLCGPAEFVFKGEVEL
ncbi:diaminopimelate epimerase [Ferruginibacter lapsinanis]|uniref:diaminopimelate epimerase n=1 Tax=Ferruginibacter lapsinanis TaxID=563172 RepID=UPI001E31646F|nr:diaminopimelate epimerase [Ferruginibacter lapsinanis]UEG48779.1 diaminopimelate epimerase [Ferruginibacter lapsinanis]